MHKCTCTSIFYTCALYFTWQTRVGTLRFTNLVPYSVTAKLLLCDCSYWTLGWEQIPARTSFPSICFSIRSYILEWDDSSNVCQNGTAHQILKQLVNGIFSIVLFVLHSLIQWVEHASLSVLWNTRDYCLPPTGNRFHSVFSTVKPTFLQFWFLFCCCLFACLFGGASFVLFFLASSWAVVCSKSVL